ncbi:MAG: hypothetical protein [Bacteriophage sp.]|nr:MAG: hypothetical protein [Bacteriophage sp.]
MDYSKLSDFEINILVAKAGGHGPLDKEQGWAGSQKEPFTAVIVKAAHILGAFDPCNNPADAWPIIMKSRINIEFDLDETFAWGYDQNAQVLSERDRKTFRAAMIVFLMMQGDE